MFRKNKLNAQTSKSKGYFPRSGEIAVYGPHPRPDRFPAKMKSTSKSNRIAALITYAALILVAWVFVAPFIWMVSTSLKLDSQIFSEKVRWIPKPFQWGNYPSALTSFPFFLYL